MNRKKARVERLKTEIEGELWPELEAEFGEMLSQPFREKMGELVITPDVNDCDVDGDPQAKAELKESLKRSIRGFYKVVKVCRPRSPNSKDSTPRNPPKTYRKPFERRFRLAQFVTEVLARDSSTRANWQRIAAEWNNAHSLEGINPEVLRVEYYRAIQEDALVHQLLLVKGVEIMNETVEDLKTEGTPAHQFFHKKAAELIRETRVHQLLLDEVAVLKVLNTTGEATVNLLIEAALANQPFLEKFEGLRVKMLADLCTPKFNLFADQLCLKRRKRLPPMFEDEVRPVLEMMLSTESMKLKKSPSNIRTIKKEAHHERQYPPEG